MVLPAHAESIKATAIAVDVRNQQQVQTLIDTAFNQFGGLDILVNNAGVGRIIPFFETTEQD